MVTDGVTKRRISVLREIEEMGKAIAFLVVFWATFCVVYLCASVAMRLLGVYL